MSRRVRWLVAGLAVLLLAILANLAAYANNRQVDLSAAASFTLSDETVSLLARVDHPLEVTAFLTTTGAAARDAGYILSRYREANHHISWSVVDPVTNPGKARAFGVTSYSTVVLTYEGRRITAPTAQESDLSTAILRLLRGSTITVCVLTGNGEPDLPASGPTDWRRWR